nr:RecName: Full=Transcriptional regulator ATRX; AltName: Full=ATP-dependent helicase ATRX; AltName: Full=X-linked nuclear protein [Notamacropus eugenii]
KDDFKGPEFRSRSKMKTENLKKRGEGLHGIVSCTACGQQVNHFQKDSIYRHPTLKVLICKNCYKYYMSDDISRDADGMDEQCRWCAEGGNLICCDFCHNAFCKKCILRNLGRKELSAIMDENSQWYCYICRPEPLLDLVTACHSVFKNLEQLLQQNKKKIKVESEKSNKLFEHTHRFSPKKNVSSCNGEEKKSDDAYSGSVTYSFTALMVPKDIVKKTKKLVETTASMNTSFVRFLKQASENPEVSPVTKLRQLKAFKSVLNDVKKVHLALEGSLNVEIRTLEALNKETVTKEHKAEGVKPDTEVTKVEVYCAPKKKDFSKCATKLSVKQVDSEINGQSLPVVGQPVHKTTSAEDKKSSRKDPHFEPANTSEALDMDFSLLIFPLIFIFFELSSCYFLLSSSFLFQSCFSLTSIFLLQIVDLLFFKFYFFFKISLISIFLLQIVHLLFSLNLFSSKLFFLFLNFFSFFKLSTFQIPNFSSKMLFPDFYLPLPILLFL